VTAACPNCGAAVEFRYDDSFVRVCDHCAHAVLRVDRGLETLGKVANLAPIESPLALFSDGRYAGSTFLLVGVAQIRHDHGGLWQEWYAKLDGRWGWLAEAQGRFYLTFETPHPGLPPISALSPGATVDLAIDGASRTFTVGEVGHARYVAARGELPFRLVPDGAFGFVDLDDGAGTFATIDFGDGGEPPTLYTGRQVTLAELGIRGGEAVPARDVLRARDVACPNCHAPIELRAPGRSQRATCTHCNALLATDSGDLAVVGRLASRPQPTIPLGTKGAFPDGELVVIGHVRRSAQIEGEWYPFDEYLLFAPEVGFRWLVDSDGHWSYVQPIAPGAVARDLRGASYDGVPFARFQSAVLRVDEVVGELYWRVEIGETVASEDFIQPPAMLSMESGAGEEAWSLGTYMTPAEVRRAFGGAELQLAYPTGKAPNQPNPVGFAAMPMALLLVALLACGLGFAIVAPERQALAMTTTARAGTVDPSTTDPWAGPDAELNPGSAAPPEPPGHVEFSQSFELDGRHNVEITVTAPLDNHWAYAALDLVNDATGDVVQVEAGLEYYSGYDDDGGWSEGSRTDTTVLGPPAAGTYILRSETQSDAKDDTPVTITVRQGVFRGRYLWMAFGLFLIPLVAMGLEDWSFERARWENSNVGGTRPKSVLVLAMLVVGFPLVAVWFILKALAANASRGSSE
jgi:hypothetical protein